MLRDRLPDVPIEATISSIATKGGMGGGTATLVVGFLTSSAGAVTIGITITVLGFIVNYVFQNMRNTREKEQAELSTRLAIAAHEMAQAEHKLRMELLLKGRINEAEPTE